MLLNTAVKEIPWTMAMSSGLQAGMYLIAELKHIVDGMIPFFAPTQ
jgi:hypothetical protein